MPTEIPTLFTSLDTRPLKKRSVGPENTSGPMAIQISPNMTTNDRKSMSEILHGCSDEKDDQDATGQTGEESTVRTEESGYSSSATVAEENERKKRKRLNDEQPKAKKRRRFYCNNCSNYYHKQSALLKHKRKRHSTSFSSSSRGSSTAELASKELPNSNTQCNNLDSQCSCDDLPSLATRHYFIEAQQCFCKHCFVKIPHPKFMADHMEKHNKSYPCPICHQYLASITLLKAHKSISHGSKYFEVGMRLLRCPECPFATEIIRAYKMHTSRHGYPGVLPCTLCNRPFCDQKAMQDHYEREHASTQTEHSESLAKIETTLALAEVDKSGQKPAIESSYWNSSSSAVEGAQFPRPTVQLITDVRDFKMRPFGCCLCFFRTGDIKELQTHCKTHITGRGNTRSSRKTFSRSCIGK